MRINELNRLFTARYGHTLPDDDAGRDDIVVMAHHLARCPGEFSRRIRNWIELRAPWMTSDMVVEIVRFVIANPIKWRADTLAQRLGLTEAERRRLGIRTIGAIDMTTEERKEARRLRQGQRDLARRRAQGARPRTEYEANSISRNKPWLTLGISRRTWYRHRGRVLPSALRRRDRYFACGWLGRSQRWELRQDNFTAQRCPLAADQPGHL